MRRLTTLLALAAPPLAAAAVFALATATPPSAGAAEGVPDLGSDAQRQSGKVVYDKWCGQCHGDTGDGRGIAAPFQLPPPRDFTAGKYKFRSTPFGTLPTDADLERTIRDGLPDTAMPGFPLLSNSQVRDVIAYLKTMSPDWQDPAAYGEPVSIPRRPGFDAERAREEGYQAYVDAGCRACHGEEGRGDGLSAPTLRDDWGHFVRVADLTMPWTFRGGGSAEDIYRTISTGINGTPMAGFTDEALAPEVRWKIVDWILSQAGGEGDEPRFHRLVRARPVEDDIALPADAAALAELFAEAPVARFPLIGQVIEPGRAFQPAIRAVEVQALFNRDEIAFLVSWNDMSAERSGENRPDLPAPTVGERRADQPGSAASLWDEAAGGVSAPPGGDAPENGDAPATDDFWGAEAAPAADTAALPAAPAAADPWGDDVVAAPATADPWGEDSAAGDPFAAAAAPPASPWADAVALQFPNTLRQGVVKPYFLFGDSGYPVELWHVALAADPTTTVWEGRGSSALTPLDRRPPEVIADYEKGRWRVAFKRPRLPQSGIGFPEDGFVPLAVTVWDGFHHERGNLRGLTRWLHVYLPPFEQPSPVGPMIRAGLGVLAVELLLVAWVRRRQRRAGTAAPATDLPASDSASATPEIP